QELTIRAAIRHCPPFFSIDSISILVLRGRSNSRSPLTDVIVSRYSPLVPLGAVISIFTNDFANPRAGVVPREVDRYALSLNTLPSNGPRLSASAPLPSSLRNGRPSDMRVRTTSSGRADFLRAASRALAVSLVPRLTLPSLSSLLTLLD